MKHPYVNDTLAANAVVSAAAGLQSGCVPVAIPPRSMAQFDNSEPMEEDRVAQTTVLLRRVRHGDVEARRELFARVLDELLQIAERRMGQQPKSHTLEPDALVNEVFLRLVDRSGPWEDRKHFVATASKAMRQILVDHARRRNAKKRSTDGERLPVESLVDRFESQSVNLVALDEAMQRLADVDPVGARLIELRFFGGQSMADTARMLGVSERTAYRAEVRSRAFLFDAIGGLDGTHE